MDGPSTVKTHSPETNAGIVTSWLPLTSTFVAPPLCSSYLLAHGDISTQALYAFDPDIGSYVNTALRCNPQEALEWYAQTLLGLSSTVTSIGPITCPEAYYTAQTTIVNSLTTQIACCPSSYSFNGWHGPASPGECLSTLTENQIFTYASEVSSYSYVSTTTSLSYPTPVTAVQINGFVFAASTETSSSLSSNKSAGLSGGAIAGIAVGVAVFAIGVSCFTGSFLLHKYKGKTRRRSTLDPYIGQPKADAPYNHVASEMGSTEISHELSMTPDAHELNWTYRASK